MMRNVLTLFCALVTSGAIAQAPSITPAKVARVGSVDARFESYNIEMVEVTGGRFWKPYGASAFDVSDKYADRAPTDLSHARLRKLAAALAPAYLRISGTWANATYFADSEQIPSAPPGFKNVLTRRQWQGVIDFSRAAGAEIVTSFAVSRGARNAAGAWMPDQASRLLAYTASIGGRIAAAEFMNEPDVAVSGVLPVGYDAAAYRRDFASFHSFVKRQAPETMLLGPETADTTDTASNLLNASASADAISYHYYGALSERCTGAGIPDGALSEQWLAKTDRALDFYRRLRNRVAPNKPIWLTETAQAACGGDRWAATFLDTFRYLDQLGRLAKAGVQVVMHNTLAASDYGLLDEKTFAPRANYWGGLLWRRLMGTTVLDSGVANRAGLHVYAHCLKDRPGGVSLLVINLDRDTPRALDLANASERYTLDADTVSDRTVRLNGRVLELDAHDDLPEIAALHAPAGALWFAPATITFLAIPDAANAAC